MGRRAFLRTATAVLAAGGWSCRPPVTEPAPRPGVRFGLLADCHYADAPTAGSRFYRDSLPKLDEAVGVMNAERVDFLVELGDFKDQAAPAVETETLGFLRAIEGRLRRFEGPTYHVLGNHDADSISKGQFLANVVNTGIGAGRSYYSFDVGGVHFVVLDANYRTDGADYDHGRFDWRDANVPPSQLQWLQEDLGGARGIGDVAMQHGHACPGRSEWDAHATVRTGLACDPAAGRPTIVFIHQLLDGEGDYYVKNAADVRAILEASGRVLAVFQGHHHQGGYSHINGIHYCTLNAVVEGPHPAHNAFAVVEVAANLNIRVTGYRNTPSRILDSVGGVRGELPLHCNAGT